MTHPDPPLWVAYASLGAALVVVGTRRGWRASRNVVTMVHEGGHALVALAVGRRLQGVRLHADTSGLTVTSGRGRGPGMIATFAAGYTAPPLVGLASAWLVAAQEIRAVLVCALVLAVMMLLAVRNLFGVLTVAAFAAADFAVLRFGSTTLQGLVAWTATWFLLVGSLRPVLELGRSRRSTLGPVSDADQLARLTPLPALMWVAFFGVVAVVSLALGGRWLVLSAG